MKTFIEILRYTDWDTQMTDCIMVSNQVHKAKHLLEDFCEKIGIPSHKGINDKELSTYTDLFIEYLEGLGFEKLNTQEVLFTD